MQVTLKCLAVPAVAVDEQALFKITFSFRCVFVNVLHDSSTVCHAGVRVLLFSTISVDTPNPSYK